MRAFHHVLQKSKSGKSIIFKIYVMDRFGQQSISYASLSGWRAVIAEKHLCFDQKEWNEDLTRKFVGMMVLKGAKDRYQGMRFLNHVKSESSMEIHFWASRFLTNKRALNAWKILNGDTR